MQQSTPGATFPERVDGEPAWEIALLFPPQGAWSELEYLSLSENRRVEFSDGRIEVLPMPSELHQMILSYLNDQFKAFVTAHQLGWVLFSGLLVKLWEEKIREPDLVVLLRENEHLRGQKYWRGADLVVEIVSEDDPNRDLVTKRQEYAKAGIREYWIVDPRNSTIAVLSLSAGADDYVEAGVYRPGERASSVLLTGFSVDTTAVFDQSRA